MVLFSFLSLCCEELQRIERGAWVARAMRLVPHEQLEPTVNDTRISSEVSTWSFGFLWTFLFESVDFRLRWNFPSFFFPGLTVAGVGTMELGLLSGARCGAAGSRSVRAVRLVPREQWSLWSWV